MNNKDTKQFSIVYQITNLLDGRIYIGVHTTYNINDNYMGSSKYLKKDIKKLGKQNFKKISLHIFDNQKEACMKEAELVTKEFCLRPDTYNLMRGGLYNFSWVGTTTVIDKEGNTSRVYKEDPRYLSGEFVGVTKGKQHSLETKEEIRKARLGVKLSKETLEKMLKTKSENRNKPDFVRRTNTPETIEKMKQSQLGHKVSEESIQKRLNTILQNGSSNKGMIHSEETKEKIRQAHTGKEMSEESKKKNRLAHLGKKLSPETIRKRLETLKKNK